MNTTFDILVIVLSVLLGLFLILSIVVISFILKLVATIRRIAERGEELVDSAEAAAEMFKRSVAPASALKSFTNIVESVIKHRKK